MVVTDEATRSPLDGLTAEQLHAVTTSAETVCVLAGAGTGKTRVLTSRAWFRVTSGSARPEHLLAITFTRKAAGELKQRLAALGTRPQVTAGTFHSIAASQLRRWWADRRTPEPVLLERKARLLAELVQGRPGFNDVSPSEVASHIEWAKARDIPPSGFAEAVTAASRPTGTDAGAMAALYARYEDEKRRRRLVDFDDLLGRYALALETDSRFAAAQRWRWQHVLVDELQDINPLQFRMLRALLGPNQDLFAVGDPNQAIYGWNGADPTFLGRFSHYWPGAELLRLDENHRSSPQVVRAGAAVLGAQGAHLRSSRPDGPAPRAQAYRSEEAEAEGVAWQMCEASARGVPWGQMAVLARTNLQLEVIAEALRRRGVPFHALAGDEAAGGPEADLEPWGDRATLCSFHRAKGLQWAAVWVCGLEAGLVPIGYATSEDALAEENRLLYVAVTRAERELYCSWAQARRAANGVALRREPSPWWSALAAHCAQPAGDLALARASTAAAPGPTLEATAATARAGGQGDGPVPKRFLGLARGRLALSSHPGRTEAATERLRDWRQRAARASGVPPQVLLHDATLKAIAAQCPATVEQLLAVPGLGPVKVARFGPAILEALNQVA